MELTEAKAEAQAMHAFYGYQTHVIKLGGSFHPCTHEAYLENFKGKPIVETFGESDRRKL